MLGATGEAATGVTLKRSLRFRDLVLYGIILIQPTAPMPSFGVIYQEARGHVVTAILCALVAMLFTSMSYGRMARAYPAGWLCIFIRWPRTAPIARIHHRDGAWRWTISSIRSSAPYGRPVQRGIFCLRFLMQSGLSSSQLCSLFCNLRGVETSARINAAMAAALGVVILLVVASILRYLVPVAASAGCVLRHAVL